MYITGLPVSKPNITAVMLTNHSNSTLGFTVNWTILPVPDYSYTVIVVNSLPTTNAMNIFKTFPVGRNISSYTVRLSSVDINASVTAVNFNISVAAVNNCGNKTSDSISLFSKKCTYIHNIVVMCTYNNYATQNLKQSCKLAY